LKCSFRFQEGKQGQDPALAVSADGFGVNAEHYSMNRLLVFLPHNWQEPALFPQHSRHLLLSHLLVINKNDHWGCF